ncbi:MAG: ferritin-like domain-containing protein [Eubacteriales bacterium]
MVNITSIELTSLREQLTQEQMLVSKYQQLSKQTPDGNLKKKYEDIAQKHQKHFDTLFSIIS